MKLSALSLFTGLALSCQMALATEYIYRDLMANTIPPAVCSAENEAAKKATQPYTINSFSKRLCQSQGYGWHVDVIKDNGKLVCQECPGGDGGKKRCYVEDVVVRCKRIKPGSVGLLPGQG